MGLLRSFQWPAETAAAATQAEAGRVYLTEAAIPAMSLHLAAHGWQKKENEVRTLPDTFLLIIYRRSVYVMAQDFSVVARKRGYGAVGSGFTYALGSFATSGVGLLSGSPWRKVVAAARRSVVVASMFEQHCGGGVDLLEIVGESCP